MSMMDILGAVGGNMDLSNMQEMISKMLKQQIEVARMKGALPALDLSVGMHKLLTRFEDEVLTDPETGEQIVEQVSHDDVEFLLKGPEVEIALRAIMFYKEEADRTRRILGMEAMDDVTAMRSALDKVPLEEESEQLTKED